MININSATNLGNVDRVYAIGDIHGRLDLLQSIELLIQEDKARFPGESAAICYLGDYVDRGPQSAEVIDHLSKIGVDEGKRVFLKGNHEDRMLAFLKEPERNGPAWMKFGGVEALESYGVMVDGSEDQDWDLIGRQLSMRLPSAHLRFLEDLQLVVRWGDYLFVHAGLNPANPTEAQDPHDLMWIRDDFRNADTQWDFIVVHGHVITEQPEICQNRIGLDTGAYKSGRLTCAAIDRKAIRIIQASLN